MDQSNSIVAFQKVQFPIGDDLPPVLPPISILLDISTRAQRYYAASSLVSNITLQSRYIVPPDISLFIIGYNGAAGGGTGTFIGPSGEAQYVYEFPDLSSWKPPSGKKTQIINWESSGNPIRNDPGIQWGGKKGEHTELELSHNGLDSPLNLPKVIKSKFMSLEATPEFTDLSNRIGKIETFLSNFSMTGPITYQSNFYLGLSGVQSDVTPGSGNWNDISHAGLWRKLV
jgi:hypothetical protein